MTRFYAAAAIAGCLIAATPAVSSAASPDQQYGFAKHLYEEGDYGPALLEYKRFMYENPNHANTATALLQVAKIYLAALGNIPKATATLKQVQETYPGTAAAQEAAGLKDYIDRNADFEGRPLIGYFQGVRLKNSLLYNEAIAKFLEVQQQYPRALLADDALIEAAKTQIEAEKREDAFRTLNRVLDEYGTTDRRDEVLYTRATLVEGSVNVKPETAIAAYQQVAPNDPENHWRVQAEAAIQRIKDAQNILPRTFEAADVAAFQVVRTDDRQRGRYGLAITLSTTLSPRQVQATIEDALLKHYQNRKQKTDEVIVEAWYNYRVTRAGLVQWTPGKAPVYTIDERKSEDVVKDAIFDLLRNR